MKRAYLEFLTAEGVLSSEQVQSVRGLIGRVREPIGSIAFSYGLLDGDDVDLILSEQRREHRPFGEIAASMGMLTHPQVNALVRVQQIRCVLEIAETLALAGMVDPDSMFVALGRFLARAPQSHREQRAAA